MAINALGAVTTAVALLVIVAAKLTEGAWITLIAIPSLILLFKRIKRYYARVDRELREPRPLELAANEPPVVVLPIESWNKLTRKALRFGMMLSPEVIVVHLSALARRRCGAGDRKVEERWDEDVERRHRKRVCRRHGWSPSRRRTGSSASRCSVFSTS